MDYRYDPNLTYSYPDRAGRDEEIWAATLTRYPGGGLERASEAHQQELFAAGWRYRNEEWTRSVQRRSVDQASAGVRRLVQRLDQFTPPPHTVGALVAVAVGVIEALADLLFYPTAEEAWRVGEAALREIGGGRREKEDPLRARFGSVASALNKAEEPVSHRSLGAGAQSYAIAESRGRTRARWDEVHCQASHVGSGGVKGLHAIESAVDAHRGVSGAGLADIERAGLTDWLGGKAKPVERIRLYRRRLAVERGHGFAGIVSDTTAREVTADITDRAILAKLTKARAKLELQLSKLPPRAAALAVATGDPSFLAPVVQRRPEREKPVRQPRRPVQPIESCAVGG